MIENKLEIFREIFALIWCIGIVPFFIRDLIKHRMPLYMRLARSFCWPLAGIISLLRMEF